MTAEPRQDKVDSWPSGIRPPVAEQSLAELVAEWLADTSGEPERSWKAAKEALNETRKERGLALVRE